MKERLTTLAIFPFMIAHSFYGFFLIWEKMFKNTCYKFFLNFQFALLQSSRFNLHFWFRLFYQTPFFKCPSSNETKALLVTIVVPKLNSLILCVTEANVQLEYFIVSSVPNCPQNPMNVRIIFLLRSTAP